ncbi:hypothetical protein CJ030_MR7G028824 [Morella rubra]|uniref:Uncharacterized protein n=1 Tax=Morella rubra TaxID=262757 RepID=A0A6A1V580_9ROSI|nr:hypothetical protein CJ030_MR7G028827 [Morella rubra]KAB1207923.1 hypothetical protein CJ030_MR7G028824 [Morella rubra]
MKLNPGHYVSLIIPLPVSEEENQEPKAVRFTRVKLLRPNETLALGHAYRLVTSQEVVKVLRAKKYAKTKQQQQPESAKSRTVQKKPSSGCAAEGKSDKDRTQQVMRHESHRVRTPSMNSAAMKSKSWRPSLQSISESWS